MPQDTGAGYQPGSLAFVQGTSLLDRAIQWATLSPFSHVRIIIADDGTVVEAVPPRLRLGTVHPDDVIVPIPYHDADDQDRAVRIARAAVGRNYSYVAGLSDFLNHCGWRYTLDAVDALNCSEVAALALGAGLDVRGMTPGRLYAIVTAQGWQP